MADHDEQLQLVTFQLGEELYGIDIMNVKEIQKVREIRPIPNAPMYVEGIFNLRGNIIPIISLHKRFHLRKAELNDEDEMLSGFMIININDRFIGVYIDKVSRVMTVEQTEIQPPPQMISGIGTEYIQGVVKEDDGYLIILDISRLFDPKELQALGDF
ncbi:MAG: chemotaxis protein CheW [Spirochaetales bacterium]|uniref:Chemotaxis protein CheW n=1 Tax=Candidatus Thalassospirochaeta sargassi TaxID=3119039 RepID=A0AAJ1IFT6_9SPIO|nr:chemotaxis protein CheW [Spirochaetales bacterium]